MPFFLYMPRTMLHSFPYISTIADQSECFRLWRVSQCFALHYRDYYAAVKSQLLNQELHTMQVRRGSNYYCSFIHMVFYSWVAVKTTASWAQWKTVKSFIWWFIEGEFDVATVSDSFVGRAIAVCFSLCHYMAWIQMHTVYCDGYSPSSLCFLDSSCLLLWATTSSGTLSKSLVCKYYID